MRIVKFEFKKKAGWGIIDSDTVKVLKNTPYEKITLTNSKIPLNKIKFLAPASPSKIVLVGLNYKDHAKELNMPVPLEPVIFFKPVTSLIAHLENIVYPKKATKVDYEAELAVVIKKEARFIPENKANQYILGFSCLNDVTERNLQKIDGQWTRAKSFDTFCPFGPWLETELDCSNLRIRSYLNDKKMQDSSTKNFIFPVNYLVSFISNVMTLLPGDIISTGTPAGIGSMRPQDNIAIEIEGIGRLVNNVVFRF